MRLTLLLSTALIALTTAHPTIYSDMINSTPSKPKPNDPEHRICVPQGLPCGVLPTASECCDDNICVGFKCEAPGLPEAPEEPEIPEIPGGLIFPKSKYQGYRRSLRFLTPLG